MTRRHARTRFADHAMTPNDAATFGERHRGCWINGKYLVPERIDQRIIAIASNYGCPVQMPDSDDTFALEDAADAAIDWLNENRIEPGFVLMKIEDGSVCLMTLEQAEEETR